MYTHTRIGGWQTSTTGINDSQWQGTTPDIQQGMSWASSEYSYSYHPYTIDFQDDDSRITRAMIESINESIKGINFENERKKEMVPFTEQELDELLAE